MQVDIIKFSASNLATFTWKECTALPVNMQDAQAVWFTEKLYVGGGYTETEHIYADCENQARLYVYTPKTDLWDTIDTPVYWFALAVYHSQLMLVGGDVKNGTPL